MKNSNILFAMIEGGGNVTPMLGLASKLLKNGHSVSILSEPCLEIAIKEIGASFLPFKEHFTRTNRKDDLFKDWNASKINNPIFERVMFGPAPTVIDRCIEIIHARSIDLVIVDVLIFPGIIAAEFLGIPKIVVFHMPEFLPGPNRPPGNMGIKTGKGFLYRLRDIILTKLMTLKFDGYKATLNEKLVSFSLPPLRHTLDLFDRVELRLIQTIRKFDIPIEPSPSNVRYIGPVLDDPDWVSGEKWVSPWQGQDEKPLVVISFSSTFQNQASTIQNSIDALSGIPVYGCVTLGPAMESDDFITPDNVVIFRSVKHSELFPQADLVITHGGHGTIIRALANGLPIICLPMGRDQYDNAMKVTLKGCGIQLSPKSSPRGIQRAVEQILSNNKYKANAKKMQDEILKHSGIEDVISEINAFIAKRKTGTTKLQSVSSDIEKS
jgi:MGT family glycosyltransferase